MTAGLNTGSSTMLITDFDAVASHLGAVNEGFQALCHGNFSIKVKDNPIEF